MKLSIRSGLVVLWLCAGALLFSGIYATRTSASDGPTSAAQQPPDSPVASAGPQNAAGDARADQDSAVMSPSQRQATDSAAVPPSGPPASGVGGAETPIDPDAAAAAAEAEDGMSVRRIAEIETPIHQRLVSVLGMITLLFIGWLLSVNRAMIPWRVVVWGLGLQIVFALLILKTPAGEAFFTWINTVIVSLLGFTEAGARFLFGNLVVNNVPVGAGEPGSGPFTPTVGMVANTGAFFAFNVLPTIVFFSSLMTMLYYLGIMQAVVKGMAWVMMRTMKTSGAETLSAAGNIFLGQTEAPLLIKPYVAGMTMSELMAVMTGGFATVAGGVMAAFVGMLIFYFPDIAGHLMAASVMSAPAALVFAKIIYPETEEPVTRGTLKVDVEKIDSNVIDAAARGAGEGLHLAMNVGAMLLAFIALIALLNALIGWIGDVTTITDFFQNIGWLAATQPLSLDSILGWVLAPLAWLMGVPWADAPEVGSLIGIKTAVNEFVAYLQLSAMLSGDTALSPRSIVIATYALCGFANFSSIAIQIGGIGGIAPSRRSDLARIGLRAMIAGSLAAFMTATIAGILV
ncbi:MAG TPA: nucleoside transporter C-terminal domain-containing protein [Longimicrobiales bacterium]|nr:nucleoside transporter C-terminal domain-containing protein [Longimicrobiales bacterium]